MHVFIIPHLERCPDELTVEGDEARRAVRVKRLTPGEKVRLIDGVGNVAVASVVAAKRAVALRIESRGRADPIAPAVHVFSAVPKGPRAAELVDNLVQAGAASWTPLDSSRSTADPHERGLVRLERIAAEATRQSRRTHFMAINRPCSFADALTAAPGQSRVLADPSGSPYTPTGARSIRVLIGPEGGFAEKELDAFRGCLDAARPQVISLGPQVMRVELAAAVAVALILDAERR